MADVPDAPDALATKLSFYAGEPLRPVLTVRPDGSVEFGADMTEDEASRRIWQGVHAAGQQTLAENAALRARLAVAEVRRDHDARLLGEANRLISAGSMLCDVEAWREELRRGPDYSQINAAASATPPEAPQQTAPIELAVIHDASGMGHIYAVSVTGVQAWSHAAIEGPWPSAEVLIEALVQHGVPIIELSPENPGFAALADSVSPSSDTVTPTEADRP